MCGIYFFYNEFTKIIVEILMRQTNPKEIHRTDDFTYATT